MKTKNLFFVASIAVALLSGCDKEEDVKPVDDKSKNSTTTIWEKNSVVELTDHFIIEEGETLKIEEGVEVIMKDPDKGIEIIVLGSLYSYGTAANPVKFTIPEDARDETITPEGRWGGIICGYDAPEVLLKNTIIEYAGAMTTEDSPSFQYQLFKTETGKTVPGFHFCNIDGKFVIDNATFRFNSDDHLYITGGKSIIMNTTFYHSGYDGGEAINYKSDCVADLAFNLIYDANTNAFKLSNSGLQFTQSHLYVYNNTIVNTGWRRPKIKGGSIWLEENIRAEVFNNLLFDTRFPVKRDASDPEDNRTVITPNYIFASTQTGMDNMQADAEAGILNGANDKMSASAGDNHPNFTNFTIQSEVDVMVGINNTGHVPQAFNTSWDFTPASGSNALSGATTAITPHYNTSGITIDGVSYKSPAPKNYFGAYGN